jgi:hypothetical protein
MDKEERARDVLAFKEWSVALDTAMTAIGPAPPARGKDVVVGEGSEAWQSRRHRFRLFTASSQHLFREHARVFQHSTSLRYS